MLEMDCYRSGRRFMSGGRVHGLPLGLNPSKSLKIGTSGREFIAFFVGPSETGEVAT